MEGLFLLCPFRDLFGSPRSISRACNKDKASGHRREDRARRRPLQKAEIRVPVAAKHATPLIRLLENPNDIGLALQRVHVGQPHQRPECPREGLELIERQVLVPEEQHLVAGECMPEQFCQIIRNGLAQVDPVISAPMVPVSRCSSMVAQRTSNARSA